MRLYPAIDIRNGKCVRLKQGDFNEVTVYDEDPVAVAQKWADAGAEYIHVVDLDGALAGSAVNLKVISDIAKTTGLPVQTGGGIRTLENIKDRLDAGVARVIIGTKAVTDPKFVAEAIKEFGADKIVVGLDGRDGKAATHGWENESDLTILDLARDFAAMGVKTIVYTDISRDGMLSGPDIMYTEKLIDETAIDIIASGGIATSNDLEILEQIGAEGAILGKSLYENKIDLKKEIENRR